MENMVSNINVPFSLGENFDRIIKNQLNSPEIAILELISNSWDANANNVEIVWPVTDTIFNGTEKFTIKDDGEGMSSQEFIDKWKSVGYNKRKDFQKESDRIIIGRNGRGRLGLFGFANDYIVSTSKNGEVSSFKVKRDVDSFAKITSIPKITNPFDINSEIISGTYIECSINDKYIPLEELKETIAIRFGANSDFNVFLNNEKIDLLNLKTDEDVVEFFYDNDSSKIIKIYKISKNQYHKRFSTYEVVWWVKNRYVEENKWKDLNINLNSSISKENKFAFLVCADFLEEEVKSDWSGFESTDVVNEVKKIVACKINEIMVDVINCSRKEKKIQILTKSKDNIAKLNPVEQKEIGNYLEEIIDKCKSITNEDFSNILEILTKMERSNKKYSFFEYIVDISIDELDKLTEIVEKWSIEDAYLVLNELYNRLELINKIDLLIDDPDTKEVQQLQPLFKEGLWIFNPKYEGTTRYTSNQSMNNVMKNILNVQDYHSKNYNKRPDFVVTEDSTVSTFTSDYYKEDSEVIVGFDELIIIELKKGASKIGYSEKEQAFRYAKEIKKKGNISENTRIIGYVLGTTVDSNEREERKEGNIVIYPKQYNLIVQIAKKRTFDLINKIKNVKGITDIGDNEINEVLNNPQKSFNY